MGQAQAASNRPLIDHPQAEQACANWGNQGMGNVGNPRFPSPVPDINPRPQRPPVEAEKGDKGDPGPPGEKGDKGDPGEVTAEHLALVVAEVLKQIKADPEMQGPPGPPADVDYEKIINEVIARMPEFQVRFHDKDSWDQLGLSSADPQMIKPGDTLEIPPQVMSMYVNDRDGPQYVGTVAERLGEAMKLLNMKPQ